MASFSIVTESTCDLPKRRIAELDLKVLPLMYSVDGGEPQPDQNENLKEYYSFLRQGGSAKTTAANPSDYKEIFTRELSAGRDLLHIGFSSGLSSSFGCAAAAAAELSGEYPERKIISVDSRSGSLGIALICVLCAEKRSRGASLEKTAEYAEFLARRLESRFTVDDLMFLKRGGRLGSVSATIGTMLGIKPLLAADQNGRLAMSGKVRGRRAALDALARGVFDDIDPSLAGMPVFIGHSDCLSDAKSLAEKIVAETRREVYINNIGPVMGAHCGPGTVAVFFIGKEK